MPRLWTARASLGSTGNPHSSGRRGTSFGGRAGVLSRCDPRAAGPRYALQRRPLRRPQARARAGIAVLTGCSISERDLECDADPRTRCPARRRARRGSFLRSGTVNRRGPSSPLRDRPNDTWSGWSVPRGSSLHPGGAEAALSPSRRPAPSPPERSRARLSCWLARHPQQAPRLELLERRSRRQAGRARWYYVVVLYALVPSGIYGWQLRQEQRSWSDRP